MIDPAGLCEVVDAEACSRHGGPQAWGGSCDCMHEDRRGREWWVTVDPFTGIAFTFAMEPYPGDDVRHGAYERPRPTLLDMARAIGRSPRFTTSTIRGLVKKLRRNVAKVQEDGRVLVPLLSGDEFQRLNSALAPPAGAKLVPIDQIITRPLYIGSKDRQKRPPHRRGKTGKIRAKKRRHSRHKNQLKTG